MAIKYNTSIVRSGLVLHLDAANTKSYKNYNLATYSQDFSNAIWNKTAGLITATGLLAPDGSYTAFTLTDADAAGYSNFNRGFTVPNDSASYNISIFIKKTTGGTSSRTGLNIAFLNGTAKYYNIRFNADTGAATSGDSNLVTSETNDYWRLSFTVSNNGTGNTALNISYYPATGVYNGSDVATATGSHTVWGLQVTRGAALLPYKTNVNDNADIWNDLSGNGNNGTLTNGPTYNSANNGSIVFNGVNNYVLVGSSSSIPYGSSARTISIWFYTNTTTWAGDVNNLFFYGNGTTGNAFGVDFSTYPSMEVYTWGGVGRDLTFSTTYLQVGWKNISITYDGVTSILIYENGRYTRTLNITSACNTSVSNVYIGSVNPVINSWYFDGNIAQTSIYNRALSATEVSQNFEAMRGRYGV